MDETRVGLGFPGEVGSPLPLRTLDTMVPFRSREREAPASGPTNSGFGTSGKSFLIENLLRTPAWPSAPRPRASASPRGWPGLARPAGFALLSAARLCGRCVPAKDRGAPKQRQP
ncbi:homeobox protein DBX2, partial [Arapaima gigas]